MCKFLIQSACLTLYVGVFFLIGCSSQKVLDRKEKDIPAKSVVDERKRDRALFHFIQGASLDAKGLYADAILEYQEALKAEPNSAIYYAISRDYAIRGNFDSAVEAAKKAIALDSNNIKYRENLANIYLSFSRIDLAVKTYEDIVKKDTNNDNAWFALANLYQFTDPNKALSIYERLLTADDSQLDILFSCAQLYISLGRLTEAEEKYKRMIELDPYNRMLPKQLVTLYINSNRLDSAKIILDKVIEADSSDYEAVLLLADIYYNKQQFKEAVGLYEYILSQNVQDKDLKLRVGIGLFRISEKDTTVILKSLNIFKEMQEAMPNDWRPYWYLGAISFNQRHDSLANIYFKQVIDIEQSNPDAWWFYIYTLFQQEKYDSIIQIIDQPQNLFPNDFRFFFLEGMTFNRLNKQERSLEPYEKALKLNPKDINTIGMLALTLDGLHQYSRSDSLYEEGLKLDSTSSLLLNNYSYSLAERGIKLEYALKMAEKAISAEPENSAYLDTYGWILYKLGNFEEAANYISKAITAGNASAVVYEHMGDVYFKLNDKHKALDFWKKALEMDPKNEVLKLKIDIGVD